MKTGSETGGKMNQPSDEFVREAEDDIRTLTRCLLELESEITGETVDEAFRAAHSLKGNCGMVGLEPGQELAHAVEDVLDGIRQDKLATVDEALDQALAAVDDLDALVAAAATGDDPPVDHTERVTALRTQLDTDGAGTNPEGSAAEDEVGADDTGDADERPPTGPVDGGSGDPDPTLTAEEALERASEFDDLDSLAAEIDIDEDENVDAWGTFADRDQEGGDKGAVGGRETAASDPADTVAPTEGAETAQAPDPPGDDPEPEGQAAGGDSGTIDEPPTFAELREEVDPDEDISELQAEIEAADFGEFDEDDDLTIRELLDVEPAGKVSSETEDAGSVVPERSASADGPDVFDDVKDEVSPDDDLDDLQSDIEAADFGEFDEDDDLTIHDLIEADPAELDPERQLTEGGDQPDLDSGSPVEGEAKTPTPARQADSEDADLSDDTVSPEGPPPAESSRAGSTAGSTPENTAQPDGTEGDTSPPATSGAEGVSDGAESDPVVGASSDPFGEAPDSAVPGETEEPMPPELDDISLPDEDESDTEPTLEVEDSSAGDPEEEIQANTSPEASSSLEDSTLSGIDLDLEERSTGLEDEFDLDSELEGFESRFGDLFDEEEGIELEEEVESLHTAAMIEDSSLDPEWIQDTYDPGSDDRAQDQRVGSVTVDAETADALLDGVERLARGQRRLERALTDDGEDSPSPEEVMSEIRGVTADLKRSVREVRLTPLSSVADRLPRVARRTARTEDKEVTFELTGTNIALDRGVVERLGNPLAHLVRNAVAHGIEPPEEREAAGKPPEGRVELRAQRDRDRVTIEITDDGRGLDADRIAAAAVEQGLITEEEADELSIASAQDLVFRPGFTTSSEVSEASGRGVGLDVVKRTTAELNGSVEIDSGAGEGTTIRLRLPVSIAVAEVLFVESGKEKFGIPVSAIDAIGEPASVQTSDGEEYVQLTPLQGGIGESLPDGVTLHDPIETGSSSEDRGQNLQAEKGPPESDGSETESGASDEPATEVPLVRLTDAFHTQSDREAEGVVVQLKPETRDLGILCDTVLETREVILKPYETVLGGVPGIGGATARGDGTLVNVIDPTTL